MSKYNYHKYLITRNYKGLLYKWLFIFPFFVKYLGKNNIDYGCGIGDFLRFCKIFKKNIVGLDVNKFNIKYCNSKKLNAKFFTNKFYSDIKHDCVILDNVLEHLEFPDDILINISNLLKKNGYFIVGVPVGEAGFRADSDHKVFYKEKTLDNLMKTYNFSKVNFFYRPWKSSYFRKKLRIYCYYAVYRKN